MLPGYRNLSLELMNSKRVEVRFTKKDLPRLRDASLFVVKDERYSHVRALGPDYPHLEEIRDILLSGDVYYRSYLAMVGLWGARDESGAVTTLISLENYGIGTWGTSGGLSIRWKPFSKHVSIYFVDSKSGGRTKVDMKLLLDDSGGVMGFKSQGHVYRRVAAGDQLDNAFDRMIEMQQGLGPQPEHPAVGVWKLSVRHLPKFKKFQYLALNPDSSVYWFNSEMDFIKHGSWKSIAGEKEIFLKYAGDKGYLGHIAETESGGMLELPHFVGFRLPVEDLSELSIPAP